MGLGGRNRSVPSHHRVLCSTFGFHYVPWFRFNVHFSFIWLQR
jgi:hypothetical protein